MYPKSINFTLFAYELVKVSRIISFVFCFFCLFAWVQAQQPTWKNPNFRTQTFEASDSVQLDLFGALSEGFVLVDSLGKPVSADYYTVDFRQEKIYFHSFPTQKITAQYFLHPQLKRENFARDTAYIYQSKKVDVFHQFENKNLQQNKPIFEGLESKGSLVRGVRFGNSQSASVQSSLDLQLSGKLSDDIQVTAAIADNNVPIESDGYTQSLQEFDKVYIELASKNSKIRAGHIDLNTQNDYFNNFNQKVTGVLLETKIEDEDSSTKIFASGSLTRGEFYTQNFNGQDGNQGPYQLRGNHAELYVIVISGSERVYIDGILVERGEDKDYVINYNTGELTFTNKRLITSNTRISVEYLYNSRNYTQLLVYGGVEHRAEKWGISGHFYSNSDSKNNTLSSDLSDEDKRILNEAGNDVTKMISVSAIPSTYDSNKVLYEKVDENGQIIYRYSTNVNAELYQVSFSYVGPNQGNYQTTNLSQNGKVYEYVAPVAGVLQGDYEPIKRLVAPKKLQMYTVNSVYQLDEESTVGVDVALSNQDLNLFSSLDDEENIGYAARLYGNKIFTTENWKISPKVSFEFWNENFVTTQRIREVEFQRDFNLDEAQQQVQQTLFSAGVDASYRNQFRLHYLANYLAFKDLYKGLKNDVGANYQTEKHQATVELSYLKAEKNQDKTTFLRYNANYHYSVSEKYWVGTQFIGEKNEWATKKSLSENSFWWNEFRLKAGRRDTLKLAMNLTLYTRKDDSVRWQQWNSMQRSNGVIMESEVLRRNTHQLAFNFHYRNVNYQNSTAADEQFMTGALKWYKSFLDDGIQLNLDYELGSGVEAQREFQYVRVADGMGIYKWTDYNGDGIEQIDEFDVAEFADQANYIRVYTNTINYLKTNKNKLNFWVRIRPKNMLRTENNFMSRWLLQTSIFSTNSTLKEGNTLLFNPFEKSATTLGNTRNFKGILFFNQGMQYRWQATYTYNQQTAKTYVYTGAEYRDQMLHNLRVRYRILANFYANTEAEKSEVQSDSDSFVNRRYSLDQYKISPSIELQNGRNLTTSLSYIYQNKKNKTGVESLKQNELKTDLQWTLASKMSVFGTMSYINNRFVGNQESVVGNQMMEGLRAGNNIVWQLQIQRQISSFLQLNLSYDGRKNESTSTIHTGSVQLQARF
ncbi:hypothetical protein QP519_01295 [Weeksella virosa]|nr:hypothetical protein [Weeksella virosa]